MLQVRVENKHYSVLVKLNFCMNHTFENFLYVVLKFERFLMPSRSITRCY